MLDLAELYQFVTYARYGTLSAAAEVLHISQPTLTRTMQHVEEAFGAKLFQRGKNRIELTDTGRFAVKQADSLLEEEQKAIQSVQAFERSLHTITVNSCAPAPLWSLLPSLSHRFPENTISSKLTTVEEIIHNVISEKVNIGILPYEYSHEGIVCTPYIKEQLFVCVPKGHALENEAELSISQLNGFNCLLRDQIGFWEKLVKQKMPASRFLIQTDEFEFEELVRTSTLLCFSTSVATPLNQAMEKRKKIPLTDSEANVTYYLISRCDEKAFLWNATSLLYENIKLQ